MKVSQEDFISVAIECDLDPNKILSTLKKRFPSVEHRPSKVTKRLENFRRKGLLPLDSGNSVSIGEALKGTSTLYDANGNIKQQWVKTDVPRQEFLEAFEEAVSNIASNMQSLPTISHTPVLVNDELATLYISNDVHLGAYMWHEDSERDWDLSTGAATLLASYDHLFAHSPNSKVGVVVDLGDLSEVDDYKNMTPKSGNILDVDSRYAKILRTAYECMIYAITKALEKHEIVYFYNIAGNHDLTFGDAIREILVVAFKDNPRVIIDKSPKTIKYHQHGSTLLQFAHGDNMKMQSAGEVMAHDCHAIFSSTTHRYSHFGHTHKDAVLDSRLCRVESHRNIAPLNQWAYAHGYRRNPGTMKSITYHLEYGEVSRQLYTINS